MIPLNLPLRLETIFVNLLPIRPRVRFFAFKPLSKRCLRSVASQIIDLAIAMAAARTLMRIERDIWGIILGATAG